MCYAVTSLSQPDGIRLNLETLEEFETLNEATLQAEERILAGHTKVRLWKLQSTAKIEKKVVWE